MNDWLHHLVIVPVLLPLVASAVMLLLDERFRKIKALGGLGTLVIIAAVSATLISLSEGNAFVYSLGNWSAPFGIVLVADMLSLVMISLASLLGFGALLFAMARWDRAGPRFYPLFMLQIMGVNGAFLTGDLFNLFVFFEVMLAASYALVLHGSGSARVKAALHYVVINLGASVLFLVGMSLIYNVTGTLNLADIALRTAEVIGTERVLFNLGVAILSVAFLIKIGMWPLGFWLPATYSSASAPAAAIFAILSKVGLYVVLRISLLLSGPAGADALAMAGFFANPWLFTGGIATILYGSIMVLASRTLSRIACACVFLSSGTILSAIGAGNPAVLSGGLYYLVGSTLGISAFFLLIELINRARGKNTPVLAEPVFNDEYLDPYEDGMPDDSQGTVVIPAAIALLSGGFFICAILLIGLPPMAGFIGKFAIMASILNAEETMIMPGTWVFISVLILSSLFTMIALLRIGIEILWNPLETTPPVVAPVEFMSIAGLLMLTVILTILSGPAMRYMDQTAAWLYAPQRYIQAVLGTGQLASDAPPAFPENGS